jgi:type IV secretion system protein VirB9
VLAHARKANDSPIREPDAGIAVGAEQVYAWSEGALYPLHAAPEHVTDIALQPGETLVSVAAGDTVRWIVGDTTSGTGETRRSHILVKPIAAGLKTNLVIATDRRVYHIEAESRQRSATTGISWTYADDGLLALGGGLTEGSAQSVTGGVAVDSLNFAYRIEGDSPAWRPLRAFDDGHQVFIEFPSTLGDGEAPPLFVRGEGGEAQLVNYRVRGRYYVVDHLFGSAELRMGERHQQVVRIVRDAKGVHHRRNAS